MPKSVSQIVQKYQTRVAGAGQDYANGVANPKADWLNQFVKAQPRMQAGIQAAIASGKIARGAQQSGGTANWQQKAANKGARNYVAAAQDAAQGYQAKADKVLQAGESARSAATALPDTTIEQRMARAMAAMKATSQYWSKG